MRHRLLVFAFAVVGVLAGCAGGDVADGPASSEELIGRAFASTSVTDRGEVRELAGARIVLEFLQEVDGIVSARWEAGCNISGGRFEAASGRLVPQPGGTSGFDQTEMGCSPEHHADDEWAVDVFGDAAAWTLEGESLVLTTGAVTIELTESTWRRR
ncbi:META domain-containing protein [Nitriliruptor alkaliphilus]|uniref:META domain-containing protein n=1 Tax=Nitriliruptor alkaliphilus TaxID=427918 RepID=UPI00069666F8|nr:META domain-containing protein [Nitriliruptor alkaliphilus]